MSRPSADPSRPRGTPRFARRLGWSLACAAVALALAAFLGRAELQRALLDPGVPYQVYKPPPAPDYGQTSAWTMLPGPDPAATPGGADVFFVHPTTYLGGRHWNAPIGEPDAERYLARVVLPNYAGPFRTVGRVFAPRYRQASLYSFSTLRDDARDARRFALRDVEAAFDSFLRRSGGSRPLVLVGVGQGGELMARAVSDALAREPTLRQRIVAVYLIHVIVPAEAYGPGAPLPSCSKRDQTGCVIAWKQAPEGGEGAARTLLDRALVWNSNGQLERLGQRPSLCVNPLTGGEGESAEERDHLGAANASGLEWGVRPPLLPRQVGAACQGGLLHVTQAHAASLRMPAGWEAALRAPPFNLFYADLEADAHARLAALSRGGAPAPPIREVIDVRPAPIHRIH